MANCSRCGCYISSGDMCSDCDNNTALTRVFTSAVNDVNRRTYENASRYSSSDDEGSYSSSSYSGGAYYEDQRNGFVSFIFAVVIGFSICISAFLACIKLGIDSTLIRTLVILISLFAGIIITFKAWRNKKNILFIIMLALAIPGIIVAVNEIKGNKSGSLLSVSTSAVITSGCNFRSGPSTNDAVIRALSQGDKVTLTGEVSSGWSQVSHNGDTGWVSTEFLRK